MGKSDRYSQEDGRLKKTSRGKKAREGKGKRYCRDATQRGTGGGPIKKLEEVGKLRKGRERGGKSLTP